MRRIIIVAIGVLSVALIHFHYVKKDNYKCATCQSRKHVSQLCLGVWWSFAVPVTPEWGEINESFLYKDFFDTDHKHDWRFFQGSPYYLFGTVWGGCELGRDRGMNEFCNWYEMYSPPIFREIVKAGIDSGELREFPRNKLPSMSSVCDRAPGCFLIVILLLIVIPRVF